MKIDDVYAICDPIAEVQAILHDHLECGKYTPQNALAKLQALMSEKGSEADIEPCRVNVAEVPPMDV